MTARSAKARGQAGFDGAADTACEREDSATAGPQASNMRSIRVGLFVSDLAVLVDRLSAPELQCYLRFRIEYVYDGACGMADDNVHLVRRLKYKHWPSLKVKLHTLGYLHTVEGLLRDTDLDVSIERQQRTRVRQQSAAIKRWRVGEIGGAA